MMILKEAVPRHFRDGKKGRTGRVRQSWMLSQTSQTNHASGRKGVGGSKAMRMPVHVR